MEFARKDYPTIIDGKVIRWTGKVNYANKPEISASQNGVLISGEWPVMTAVDIEQVKHQLDVAVDEYLELEKNNANMS